MYVYNLINVSKKKKKVELNTDVAVHTHHSTYEYSLKYYLTTSLTKILRSKTKMHENWT